MRVDQNGYWVDLRKPGFSQISVESNKILGLSEWVDPISVYAGLGPNQFIYLILLLLFLSGFGLAQ
jgi:hypothetical protein